MPDAPVLSPSDVSKLVWWGSDCEACGNANVDSMTCDECGSDEHTHPLFVLSDGR